MDTAQVLSYLDIKATANRWAAEYGLEDDDMWTHPFTNVRMTITQVLWSLYTERHMSLEGMKMHFDRHGIFAVQARREAEQGQEVIASDPVPAAMPHDMVMYWREIYGGDRINPPEAAPVWEFCDEDEAPDHFSLSDETGLVLVEG